jgi:hypothetical protein
VTDERLGSGDLDPIFQSSRLPYARQDDDRATCLTEQKVLVLREKHHVMILKSFTDASVSGATPSERDDMLRRQAIVLQAAEQSERKILVEENDHDA